MPNWCDNGLNVIHKDPEMITKLVNAWKEDRFFKTIYPEPDYKTTPVPLTYPEISAQFAKSEEEKAKLLANEPTIREDSWWDWRVQNWGTKWEVNTENFEEPQMADDGLSFFVYFDTAWSPPIGIYQKLVEQGYEVDANYVGEGCEYAGIFNNEDGDLCVGVDYPEGLEGIELNKWIKANIPQKILNSVDLLSHLDCEDWQLEEADQKA